jgi:hypothetical protein
MAESGKKLTNISAIHLRFFNWASVAGGKRSAAPDNDGQIGAYLVVNRAHFFEHIYFSGGTPRKASPTGLPKKGPLRDLGMGGRD